MMMWSMWLRSTVLVKKFHQQAIEFLWRPLHTAETNENNKSEEEHYETVIETLLNAVKTEKMNVK